MKLFLASYRFGAHVDEFLALTSGPGRIAVIANAADAWPAAARASAVMSELRDLRGLGYEPHELDLRDFVGRPSALADELDGVDTLWIRGGNTFVLEAQMERCDAGDAITSRVRGGSLVYAGYSAGACVAQESLSGIEAADDPADVAATTAWPVPWTGLGLIDIAFVPHFRSVLDEGGVGDQMVARYAREDVTHMTLTDEQVYVVDGERAERI